MIRQFIDENLDDGDTVLANDRSIAPLVGKPLPTDLPPTPSATNGHITRKERIEQNKHAPVWKQEVYDEKGRKRFHGAFTGGFSAGYFNTVGSKKGWAPSEFKSSRAQRGGKQEYRPEDFMDEEDFEAMGIGADRSLKERAEFRSFGSEQDEQRQAFAEKAGVGSVIPGPMPTELLGPSTEDSIGVKLLKVMGWKEGFGIGPRRRRRLKKPKRVYGVAGIPNALHPPEDGNLGDEEEEDDPYAEQMLFAPKDANVLEYLQKTDPNGIGFDPYKHAEEFRNLRKKKAQVAPPTKKRVGLAAMGSQEGSFGIGAFEESDDIEVYDVDKMDAYDTTIGDENDPVVIPDNDKISRERGGAVVFMRATQLLAPPVEFPAPVVPRTFNPVHKFPQGEAFKPLLDMRLARLLTADQRGLLLGESQLKGSVFDLLSPADRAKLEGVAQTTATTTPAAPSPWQSLQSRFAPAAAAPPASTEPTTSKPFKDDPGKQRRYEFWLLLQKGQVEEPQEWNDGLTPEERRREHDEFKRTWGLFGPLSSMMARRFQREGDVLPKSEEFVTEDYQKTAASMKMFGALTRAVVDWQPSNLLCKRFNIRPPKKAYSAPNTTLARKQRKPVDDETALLRGDPTPTQLENFQNEKKEQRDEYDPEQPTESPDDENEIKEVKEEEKSSIDLFKAIFEDEEDFAEPEPEPESSPPPQPNQPAPAQPPGDQAHLAASANAEEDDFAVQMPTRGPEQPPAGIVSTPLFLGPTLPPPPKPRTSVANVSITQAIKDMSAEQLKNIIGDSSDSDSDSDSSSSDSDVKRKSKSKEKRRAKHKDKHRDKDKHKSRSKHTSRDKDKHKSHNRSKRKRDEEDKSGSSSKRTKGD